MHTYTDAAKGKTRLAEEKRASALPPYPIDMVPLLSSWQFTLDAAGVPSQVCPKGYQPGVVAQYALIEWNNYAATNDENHRNIFLTQAQWLVEHEVRIGNDGGGWPVFSPHPDVHGKGPWLSALLQGNALSVLTRAYQLTQEKTFLEAAHRIVRTFEWDILDGGVSAPIGENGVFFEEVAAYPASHILTGFIFGLLALYEYVALTGDAQIKALIQRSLSSMHVILNEFDVGFWTRVDLLHRKLASPNQLALQIKLLEAVAIYSDCQQCSRLVARWKSYQHTSRFRLRYLISSRFTSFGGILLSQLRSRLFPRSQVSPVLRVCVPVTGFPITGGMHTILTKIEQVTSDAWQMEYLTRAVGPGSESFVIHQFGGARSFPWEFPHIWFYVFAGFRKLTSLIRAGASYDVILPQDGIFTAAFAGLAGKLAGVRVVCIDHGNLVALTSRTYRTHRLNALATEPWIRRLIKRILFVCYWPSLYILAWFAARFIDSYCVPGVVGDGVEDICRRLGIGPSRLTRFVNTVDLERHIVLNASSKAEMREKNDIPADAVVITTICRLVPEKGVDIALEAISYALSQLSPELRERVRFIIAGEGILRKQIEEDISRRQLSQTCLLWGEATQADVLMLHSLSDIYLYTGTRGGGYSLVMLEAMASGCAVIAAAEPLANVRMLAEGRGVAVPVGDAKQTGMALAQLISNSELRCQMGRLARDYVAVHNTAALFRRVWMRATYWSALEKFLKIEESEG